MKPTSGIPKQGQHSPSIDSATWFSLMGHPPREAKEGFGWTFDHRRGWREVGRDEPAYELPAKYHEAVKIHDKMIDLAVIASEMMRVGALPRDVYFSIRDAVNKTGLAVKRSLD